MTTATVQPETPVKRVGPQSTNGKRPEVDAAVDRLVTVYERFRNDPSAFRMFLWLKGRMHKYSENNLALIMIDAWLRQEEEQQKYDAWKKANPRKRKGNPYDPSRWDKAMLAMGYTDWQNAGRQVIKRKSDDNPDGSQAIALFAPIFVKDQDETGKIKDKLIGFKVIARTFHVQDTVGPEFETPTPKRMDDADDEETVENTKRLCRLLSRTALDDLGVPKIIRDASGDKKLGMAQGCLVTKAKGSIAENTIIIKSTMSYAQSAKTLAHEMAHVVAEHGKVTNYHSDAQQRAACEAIAEGAAFVVMSHYGYDTTDYTVPYIAGWATDENTLRQVIKDISDVAKAIINKTEAKARAAA